jgi:hypothetical protein
VLFLLTNLHRLYGLGSLSLVVELVGTALTAWTMEAKLLHDILFLGYLNLN